MSTLRCNTQWTYIEVRIKLFLNCVLPGLLLSYFSALSLALKALLVVTKNLQFGLLLLKKAVVFAWYWEPILLYVGCLQYLQYVKLDASIRTLRQRYTWKSNAAKDKAHLRIFSSWASLCKFRTTSFRSSVANGLAVALKPKYEKNATGSKASKFDFTKLMCAWFPWRSKTFSKGEDHVEIALLHGFRGDRSERRS